ncbi:hypothetical protein [Ancylobacter polymorphus]|uniref:Uncharacterized protein n=1 Tax=Ancylobacter polymorphus TaxID=223390 RepID=A0A9E7A2W6_9HYPH|nr:hypothetical protein [Ancylobacter polymorphus]UOK71698.1 hypothetical protein K9D25_02945 [Ancylobacter polymorphus]
MMLTHKGWFGVCPVYIGGLDSPAPLIHQRHWLFLPLFILSEHIFAAIIYLKSWQDPEWEPSWPLRVTGTIEPRKAP